MASIITTDIIRYDHPESPALTRSHVLHPQSDITIIIILSAEKENVMSVIEDHLLESISSTEWNHGEEDTDFSYVTEKFNHFLSNLAHVDLEKVGIIFAVERGGHLMVSSIGDAEVILEDSESHPIQIHEDTRGHHHFELISSGDIPVGSSVFIVSRNLENTVGDTFYTDCAHIESEALAITVREVIARDVHDTIHLARIQRTGDTHKKEIGTLRNPQKITKIKEVIARSLSKISNHPRIQDTKEGLHEFFQEKHSYILSIFLVIGVILFFGLVSYVVSALFGSTQGGTRDAKNQVIEAKTLVDSSQKLTGSPMAFDATIKQAEAILVDLEKKNLFSKDVIDLRNRIEAMKKELYDVQTVNLSGRQTIVPFNTETFSPLGIYEKDKKINIIGKDGIIQGYALGDTGLQIKQYPTSERAKDYTTLDDGNFYILTESNKILSSRKNADITYINIVGQDGWEKADGIETFNGNIYLWNKGEGQVYKHKPSINGFGQKNPVLSNPGTPILDIGIDGGFYIIKEDGKINRIVGTATNTGILLNNIPGDYTIGKNPLKTHIITNQSLNYIYVLDGNRVWIFSPDSKRFQDIKSWTYIAQMELSTTEEILDINLPRDGLIYILTDKGVYDISFEFVENNILLR